MNKTDQHLQQSFVRWCCPTRLRGRYSTKLASACSNFYNLFSTQYRDPIFCTDNTSYQQKVFFRTTCSALSSSWDVRWSRPRWSSVSFFIHQTNRREQGQRDKWIRAWNSLRRGKCKQACAHLIFCATLFFAGTHSFISHPMLQGNMMTGKDISL